MTSTFRSFDSITLRWSTIRPQSPSVGSRRTHRIRPPMSDSDSTRCTASNPRRPSATAHSMPAGPAPTTRTAFSALDARSKRSGCQPAAVFLARRRVLDAAEVSEPVDLHDADVRTGAFADLVGAALLRSSAGGTDRRSTVERRRRGPTRRCARSRPCGRGSSAVRPRRSASRSPGGCRRSIRADSPPGSSETCRSPCSNRRSSRRSRPRGPPGRQPD